MRAHRVERFGRNRLDPLAHPARKMECEIANQRRNVVAALAHADREDLEPLVEVGAELLPFEHRR